MQVMDFKWNGTGYITKYSNIMQPSVANNSTNNKNGNNIIRHEENQIEVTWK